MFNENTSFEDLMVDFIKSDKELTAKLKQKISEALDKVNLDEKVQQLMENLIGDADIDIEDTLKTIINKKLKESFKVPKIEDGK